MGVHHSHPDAQTAADLGRGRTGGIGLDHVIHAGPDLLQVRTHIVAGRFRGHPASVTERAGKWIGGIKVCRIGEDHRAPHRRQDIRGDLLHHQVPVVAGVGGGGRPAPVFFSQIRIRPENIGQRVRHQRGLEGSHRGGGRGVQGRIRQIRQVEFGRAPGSQVGVGGPGGQMPLGPAENQRIGGAGRSHADEVRVLDRFGGEDGVGPRPQALRPLRRGLAGRTSHGVGNKEAIDGQGKIGQEGEVKAVVGAHRVQVSLGALVIHPPGVATDRPGGVSAGCHHVRPRRHHPSADTVG